MLLFVPNSRLLPTLTIPEQRAHLVLFEKIKLIFH